MANESARVRMSLRELCKPEHADKLNAFLRAWKLIKQLPPDNPNSFWAIASYHGEPFKPRMIPGYTNEVWSGYCQHSNVLFPTWHRFYVYRLEQALNTVCPTDNIAMPYWDESSKESMTDGLPEYLQRSKVDIDGVSEPNPFLNFILPEAIDGDEHEYYLKPKGYTTVRYPFSGIMSPPKAAEIAKKHNAKMAKLDVEKMLSENISNWLGDPIKPSANSVFTLFKNCLDAPDYNTFSNTNSDRSRHSTLEQPHNDIHLAIGGFDLPIPGRKPSGIQKGANGDMGENETAAFDPCFFFHHCNIDRMFWVWQKKHGFTDDFVIDPTDLHGTNPTGGQGPTPWQQDNQRLNMATILYPYQAANGMPVNSYNCVNIEKQMGYTYSIGSLDKEKWDPSSEIKIKYQSHKVDHMDHLMKVLENSVFHENISLQIYVDLTKFDDWHVTGGFFTETLENQTVRIGSRAWKYTNRVHVSQILRSGYPGSFVVRAYYKTKDTNGFIGQRGVLDRWNRKNCKNCNVHRFANVSFDLNDFKVNWPINMEDFYIEIDYKDPNAGEVVTEDPFVNSPEAPIKSFFVIFEEI